MKNLLLITASFLIASCGGDILTDALPKTTTLSLENDTGISDSDWISNDATMLVLGLEGGEWEYSLDAGSTYEDGVDSSFELEDSTTYAINDIKVRTCELTGSVSLCNRSPNKHVITIDTVAPLGVSPIIYSLTTSITKPEISGYAVLETGEYLSVEIGDGVFHYVDVSEPNWTIDTQTVTPYSETFTPLSLGSHDVTATILDLAGNIWIPAIHIDAITIVE